MAFSEPGLARSLVVGAVILIALIILVRAMTFSGPAQDIYTAGPVEPLMSGPQVYNEACLMCHGEGVGGAPINGDAVAWSARIALGNDTLYQHAIEGYTGEAGFMPAKGARMDLSDEEVRAAVDYMVDESGN